MVYETGATSDPALSPGKVEALRPNPKERKHARIRIIQEASLVQYRDRSPWENSRHCNFR